MTAVQIDHAARFNVTGICRRVCSCLRVLTQHNPVASISWVLVVVVTEVLDCGLGFVSAIRGYRRPSELERQKGKQNDGEESTHGLESSGYRFSSRTRGERAVGFHHF